MFFSFIYLPLRDIHDGGNFCVDGYGPIILSIFFLSSQLH